MTPSCPDFVVFSDDWGRHPSSCQHLFARISRDHRVLWVDTIGLRAAKADKFTAFRGVEKLRKWLKPLRQVHDRMWVFAPVMLPVSGDGLLGRANRWWTAGSVRRTLGRLGMKHPVLFASVPTAIDFVGRLSESAVAYYITDDYSLWPGGNAGRIRAADEALARSADLVLPCNEVLSDLHRHMARRMHVLPHAVDLEHFARPCAVPDDLPAHGGPRVCFFGLVYEKIDLPLLALLAKARKDVQIVLIGPVRTDTSVLKGLANVVLLGARPYECLPAYLQAMDVLVVPYVVDEETLRKGPLKIRECLASGKPTVARSIPDLEQYRDLVKLYDDPNQFVPAVDAALQQGGRYDLAQRMRSCIVGDTWEARADTVREQVQIVLAEKRARLERPG
jgi:glycosyltransferase involved in cell wall biosynthesis